MYSALATRLDVIEGRFSMLEHRIVRRMRESDEIICKATEVLATLSTNTAKARDEARDETTKIKARLDLDREERREVNARVDGWLGQIIDLIEKRKVSMRDVVELVDAARVPK